MQNIVPNLNNSRLESIQILRGLAAFGVMMLHLTHYSIDLRPGMPKVFYVFRFGEFGVNIFFVVSGFVIPHYMKSTSYNVMRDGLTFLVSRLMRLEPPYLVSIAATLLLSYLASFSSSDPRAAFHFDPLGIALHFLYLAPWFGKEFVQGVYWTLAIEFQYYIFMLIFGGLLISKRKSLILLFFAIELFLSYFITDSRSLFPYLSCFAFGHLAFLYYHSILPKVVMLAGVILTAMVNLLTYPPLIFGVYGEVLASFLAFCFILLPIRKPVFILSGLGSISYSLYLLHFITGLKFVHIAERGSGSFLFIGVVGGVLVSCVAAYVMYRFVELPAMKFARDWASYRKAQSRQKLAEGVT